MILNKILKNETTQNAGWLIGGKIVQMLISMVVGLLTARYLGPSNYGLINYAGAYTSFFLSLCTLGINSVIVKEFIDNPNEEGKIIGTSLVLRVVSSFLSAAMIVCISVVVDAQEPITILVVSLCSIGLLFNVMEVYNYWFQSRLQSKVSAITTLIAYSITAAFKVYLVMTEKSVMFFAFATSVDYICIGILLMIAYKRYYGGKLCFSRKYAKQLLGKSAHFILPGLMVAIYSQTDKLMLKQMISVAEIGFYSTAVTICSMWTFVLSAIIDSMYPSIMEASRGNKIVFEKKNKLLYAIVFYISAVVSIFFAIFAKPIVLILYGEEFIATVSPLRIITWYTAFSYLGVARNAWIVCKNAQKYLIYIYISAAVTNVILNYFLIPVWGASGAALATLTAQIITTMIAPLFIKNLRKNSIMILEAILLKDIK